MPLYLSDSVSCHTHCSCECASSVPGVAAELGMILHAAVQMDPERAGLWLYLFSNHDFEVDFIGHEVEGLILLLRVHKLLRYLFALACSTSANSTLGLF